MALAHHNADPEPVDPADLIREEREAIEARFSFDFELHEFARSPHRQS